MRKQEVVMSSLIETWEAAIAFNQCTKREGLNYISNMIGVKYDFNKLSEWRTGVRPIPDRVKKIMMFECIDYALKHSKSNKELVKMLSPPDRI